MAKQTYVAITSVYGKHYPLAVAHKKDEALEAGKQSINEEYGPVVNEYGQCNNIEVETAHKNLFVTSKTKAKRWYGIDIDDAEYLYGLKADEYSTFVDARA